VIHRFDDIGGIVEHHGLIFLSISTIAGFTYRLDRLKPRASKFTIALHFRIFQNFKHPSSSYPLLELIKHTSSSREGGELGKGLTCGLA